MRCDIRFSFRLVVLDPVPGEKWRSFQKFILHVNTSQSGVSENHHLIYLIDNPLKFVFIVLPTCTSLNTHLQKRSLSNKITLFMCLFLVHFIHFPLFLVQKTSLFPSLSVNLSPYLRALHHTLRRDAKRKVFPSSMASPLGPSKRRTDTL